MEELKKRRVERMIEMNKPSALKAAPKASEPREAELSEEEKAKQRSKPVSSTAVPGTPWCVVWTRDKRVFFYNPSEKQSLWERPHLLQGRLDVDKLVREPPAAADFAGTESTNTNVSVTNNSSPNTNSNVNNSQNNNHVKKKSLLSADNNNAEPPLKKNK